MKDSKAKCPRFRENSRHYFKEFFQNSSLHGFKYIGAENSTIAERIFWVIVFCISIIACVMLIMNTWIKWERSPILMNFAPSPTSLRQIPFPAVTICLGLKIDTQKFDFNYYYRKDSEGEHVPIEIIEDMCRSTLICRYDRSKVQCRDEENDEKVTPFLSQIVPEVDDVIKFCRWRGRNVPCSSLFSLVLTNLGFCYTFNMLNKSEIFTENLHIPQNTYVQQNEISGWDIDDGYLESDINETESYPRRVLLASGRYSLSASVFDYPGPFCEHDYNKMFKILLHHPSEAPRPGITGTRIYTAPFGYREVQVVVKPDIKISSSELKHEKPQRKQCYHLRDGNLHFFKIHTRQNCLSECVANYTLSKLGCSPFYMPHKKSTKICHNFIESALIEEDLYNDKDALSKCGCLSSCNSIIYNAEISTKLLQTVNLYNSSKKLAYKSGYSTVNVYFEDMEFTTIERKELFSTTDFWANCGGLLGLFIGFSFLSFVEMVYFFTFRICCNIITQNST